MDGVTAKIDRTLARTDLLNLTGITDVMPEACEKKVTAGNSQTFGYSPVNRLHAAMGPTVRRAGP